MVKPAVVLNLFRSCVPDLSTNEQKDVRTLTFTGIDFIVK